MRSAQVYRWQIPMDAGVVLRDRRLKTRDGLYVCLREGEREGWGGDLPTAGLQPGNLGRGRKACCLPG
ncbi:O-succinylbenzoate synthase [Escherichia coli]|uniref:O-succinylbenzoate synthase n=1 Tax=Escherichia coli TaxID=562 RepID=A0A2X3K4D0_ECOLX|nr:O-succinylbenzoate synthase [Escherichia coli]